MAGDSRLEQLAKTARNPVEETEYQNLLKAQGVQFTVDPGNKTNVAGFGYGGNDTNTDQFVNSVAGQFAPGAGGGQAPVDLPGLYEKLYANSTIKDRQQKFEAVNAEVLARQKARDLATTTINDNPFYSEGTRVGRIEKLNQIADRDIGTLTGQQQAILGEIEMQKADIETKLNIQMKQFDINSQQAQNELNKFNTLLASGALDNASNLDIAILSRQTGIPTSMIRSAQELSVKRNTPKAEPIPTQFMSFDDGVNSGFALVNSQTGEVIKKETLAVAQKKPGGSGQPTEKEQKAYYENTLRQDAQKGLTLSQIFSLYTGYVDPDKIYQLYNANSKYGPHKGDASDVAKYGVTQE